MHTFRFLLLASLALAASLLPALRPAQAAETYHTCTGFIDSLPAVVSTQGVWCLRKNIGTSITSGSAIRITTNNVTIDCNNFKLGGLAGGDESSATGISAFGGRNLTIRNCGIRGFMYGIHLNSVNGYLIEDNRLDNNLSKGIWAYGQGNNYNVVRRNRVYDTGGQTHTRSSSWIEAISSDGDIIDNMVVGMFSHLSSFFLGGIAVSGAGARVSGNTVSGFDMTAAQGGAVLSATGIYVRGRYVRVSDNHLSGSGGPATVGIDGSNNIYASAYCTDNTIAGFKTPVMQCNVGQGNLNLP